MVGLKSEFIAINKPVGVTSHDVVDVVRKLTKVKKVGHAGTLDPLASGVFVVGVGREATKKLHSQMIKEKEYSARVCLGVDSTTGDDEGEKTKYEVRSIPSEKEVGEVLRSFEGNIYQTPPVYSAVKIKGKPAYKYARKGIKVKMKPRLVVIKKIVLDGYKWPEMEIRVVTGSGVYIRSLARDIGGKLKCGGYLLGLVRTRVGDFTIDKALRMSELGTYFSI